MEGVDAFLGLENEAKFIISDVVQSSPETHPKSIGLQTGVVSVRFERILALVEGDVSIYPFLN